MCLFSGGAIGSGLFIGSAGSFTTGGPASVVIGFFIIGMLNHLDALTRKLIFLNF